MITKIVLLMLENTDYRIKLLLVGGPFLSSFTHFLAKILNGSAFRNKNNSFPSR